MIETLKRWLTPPAALVLAARELEDVYNLVQRGMLENVGTRRFGRFLVVPGTSLEPVREFRATPEIIQAASVWEYARRCAMETRA